MEKSVVFDQIPLGPPLVWGKLTLMLFVGKRIYKGGIQKQKKQEKRCEKFPRQEFLYGKEVKLVKCTWMRGGG